MDPITELLTRRIDTILPSKESLETLLRSGKKIRLYQGFDPTGSRLHLGHTIGMRNLNAFAKEGHKVFAIFGTGTVLVGDPSERDTGRKLITDDEIQSNLTSWKEQVSKVMDLDDIEIVFNGDWLIPLTLKDIINIASNISAIQLFKRDSFQRRLDQGETVWYHETMYPLLQGYDSVHLNVDLEIGGTDQTFNMLVGRELQKKINHKEKWVLTNPMIMGTDGKQMSKTAGNCIFLDDSANDMYGKTMSIIDSQIPVYFRQLTDIPLEEIDAMPNDPMNNKKRLAFEITKQFHGHTSAQAAQDHFEKTVQHKETPSEIKTITITNNNPTILDLCRETGVGESSGHIKRTIEQGGVEINGQKITDINHPLELSSGDILKFGKRTFIKVEVP
jgi:tyrosyl-tRNA synthetase